MPTWLYGNEDTLYVLEHPHPKGALTAKTLT